LDGARTGVAANEDALKKIIKQTGLFVQTSGGIRHIDDVKRKLDLGASRVIIGTAAVTNPALVEEALALFGDKIAVGIDAKAGFVATDGWQFSAAATALEHGSRMAALGIKTIIYTDISKDGMLEGANVEATKQMMDATGCAVIASGGVTTMDDLLRIKKIGAAGVIIGKALYAGRLDLKTVVEMFE
jgi:phosphoribosylformimino-5-aminoimidazole carboxamide ribotide isomerase